MLSIGIRCGQGFDKNTLAGLIEAGNRLYEYDVLILGTNPGGLACAKEAVKSGEKIALVSWRIPTPGEKEGHEEDRQEMMEALQMDERSIRERTHKLLEQDGKIELMPVIKFSRHKSSRVSKIELRSEQKQPKWWRKVRRSRLDVRNALTDMALEGVRYLHAATRDTARSKTRATKSRPMSWGRMIENLLDHIIEKRWHLLTDLLQSKISIYNGHPISVTDHSVMIKKTNGEETILTAETIITALEVQYSFPSEVVGSREFGVNVSDFSRLSSPGKTLVVGGGQLGLTCAGILASFGFPVTLVYRNTVLKYGDMEIVDLIVKNLQGKGVKFMEKQSLISIQLNKAGDALVAEFIPVRGSKPHTKKKYSERFDTVLFTTIERPNMKNFGKSRFQVEYERLTGKPSSAKEKQDLQNYINIPPKRGNDRAAVVIGKHIGEQLFGTEERLPNLNLIPTCVLTPIEYAYLGTSEQHAKRRLGEECVEICKGHFQTEDVLSDTTPSESDVHYAKVVYVREKDLILGLHIFGRDAVQIMDKILEPIQDKVTTSNLHPAIRNLIKPKETVTTSDDSPV